MAANSNQGLSDRCSKEAEEATAIKLQSPFLSLCCEVCHANGGDRYFNRGKLDYPNQATSKASKKYVKAMKALKVCFPQRSIYLSRPLISMKGHHSIHKRFQQTIPRSATKNLCV